MAHQKHPTLAARVEVLSPTVSPGDELRYVVVNAGDVPIMLGAGYELDRWMSDEWEPVRMRLLVPLWGRRIEPGDQSEDSFPVRQDLLPGRYRLRKRLDPNRDPVRGYEWVAKANIAPIEPTAEFELRPGEPSRPPEPSLSGFPNRQDPGVPGLSPLAPSGKRVVTPHVSRPRQ